MTKCSRRSTSRTSKAFQPIPDERGSGRASLQSGSMSSTKSRRGSCDHSAPQEVNGESSMDADFLPALTVSVDENTGRIRAAYMRIRRGDVAETRELAEGRVFADYSADGLLLGIELL